MPDAKNRTPVLIASFLEQALVDRIAAAEPDQIELLYTPELLPPPRYEADHHAPRRALDAEQLARWRALVARAGISVGTDWDEPATMMARAPGLRWVQTTSSGIGPRFVRLGVAGSPLIVTNAAGIHAQPLAEFVLHGVLHFTKESPRLAAWKSERHWERYCGETAGKRMLVVGLGKVGAHIAQLSAAIGIEVIGVRRRTGAPTPPGVRRVIDTASIDAELPAIDFLVLAAPTRQNPEPDQCSPSRAASILRGRNQCRPRLVDRRSGIGVGPCHGPVPGGRARRIRKGATANRQPTLVSPERRPRLPRHGEHCRGQSPNS